MDSVSDSTVERKIEEALRRSLPKFGPKTRSQVEALLTPEAMATVAAVLVAWTVSHAFGVGEVIDVVILAVGALAIGLAVFTGVDHLYQFAIRACRARSLADLDAAATHFATVVSILGIQGRGAGPRHSPALRGSGLLTEITGLTTFGVVASGISFDLFVGPGNPAPPAADEIAGIGAHGASGSW